VSLWRWLSPSPDATWQWAKDLGLALQQPLTLLLSGPLGSGKTLLVQGLASGLGVADTVAVTSPTYGVMHCYEGRLPLYHFDLYRLAEPDELSELGLEEYLWGQGVAVVEWAERLGLELPEALEIQLLPQAEEQRWIEVRAQAPATVAIMEQVSVPQGGQP